MEIASAGCPGVHDKTEQRGGLLALASGDELRMAEAYVNGLYDIAGDMTQALALGEFLQAQRATLARRLGRMLIRMRPAAHSLESDRNAIRHHYDVSNDFYRQWLDSRMVYSCAYFSGGNEDLESAQLSKLDYICRKLRLKPGDRFLDVGCGWGGLIMHASRKYGAHAVGITLSKAQAELAGSRVTENGLAETCAIAIIGSSKTMRSTRLPASGCSNTWGQHN